MTAHVPDKRPAYEPAGRLLRPTGYDPDMKRPVTTVAGALLVLLGVIAGAVVLFGVAQEWNAIVADPDLGLDDETIEGATQFGLWLIVGFGAAVLAFEILLAVLIYRGLNWPRVWVMFFAVLEISGWFVAWWAEGQEIRIEGSFASVALGILLLLALSSRSAAAYARRNERR